MSKDDYRRHATDPRIKMGNCWGDEVCDLCPRPAQRIVHLMWPDGVDQDYGQACSWHLGDVAGKLEAKWRQRR